MKIYDTLYRIGKDILRDACAVVNLVSAAQKGDALAGTSQEEK